MARVNITTVLLGVIAIGIVAIAARLEYNARKQPAHYDLGTCMAHLAQMDTETRNECIQAHTSSPLQHDPLAEFGKVMEQTMRHPAPAENPEDRRLDARGLK